MEISPALCSSYANIVFSFEDGLLLIAEYAYVLLSVEVRMFFLLKVSIGFDSSKLCYACNLFHSCSPFILRRLN